MGTPLPDGREGEEWPVSTAGLAGRINNGKANSIAFLPKSKTHYKPGERKKRGHHQTSPMAGDKTCFHIINCFLVVFVCLLACFFFFPPRNLGSISLGLRNGNLWSILNVIYGANHYL